MSNTLIKSNNTKEMFNNLVKSTNHRTNINLRQILNQNKEVESGSITNAAEHNNDDNNRGSLG